MLKWKGVILSDAIIEFNDASVIVSGPETEIEVSFISLKETIESQKKGVSTYKSTKDEI